jgi:hypothetical protein
MLAAHAFIHPFSPKAEGTCFELSPHKSNNFRLADAKLMLDGLEGCSVFPGHLNDTVGIFCSEEEVFHD